MEDVLMQPVTAFLVGDSLPSEHAHKRAQAAVEAFLVAVLAFDRATFRDHDTLEVVCPWVQNTASRFRAARERFIGLD
jgi:hypothetical protein